MDSELAAFAHADPVGETATHPIARLARCLAALLLVAGNGPAALSRLAKQRARRTPGHVQLQFLGLIICKRSSPGSECQVEISRAYHSERYPS